MTSYWAQKSEETVRELIKRTRELTDRPFGLATVLVFPHEDAIRVALEEKIAAVWVGFGEFPAEQVEKVHKEGVKVVHQVSDSNAKDELSSNMFPEVLSVIR